MNHSLSQRFVHLAVHPGALMHLLGKQVVLLAALAALMLSTSAVVFADGEEGQLLVYGNLKDEGKRTLDMDFIRSMEQTSFKTKTPWTEGQRMFTGVRISTLLESVGAESSNFEAIAINDYRFTLKDLDFDKYPVIIAYEIDGEPLTIKTLGPLWIIFPFDDYPELLTQSNKAASVWQLIELNVL